MCLCVQDARCLTCPGLIKFPHSCQDQTLMMHPLFLPDHFKEFSWVLGKFPLVQGLDWPHKVIRVKGADQEAHADVIFFLCFGGIFKEYFLKKYIIAYYYFQ